MVAALGVAVGLGASAALAADAGSTASPAPPQAQSFTVLDTNRDGQLSRGEVFGIVR